MSTKSVANRAAVSGSRAAVRIAIATSAADKTKGAQARIFARSGGVGATSMDQRAPPNKTKGLPHPLSATVAPFRAWRGSRRAVGRPTRGLTFGSTLSQVRRYVEVE